MAPKPLIKAGVALTSAALIVAGTPALLDHEAGSVTASAPTPTKISSAKYELAALTADGLIDAYVNGYGGHVGGPVANGGTGVPDPYFPGFSGQLVNAAPGALYYVVDNTLKTLGLNFDLDDYYFEIGNYTANTDPTFYSGLAAVTYVGANEYFGPEAGALVDLIQESTYYAQQAIIGLAAATIPIVHLGTLTVGGGILASVYFSGGLPAVGTYIINSFLHPVVPTPPTPPTASAAVLAKAAPEVEVKTEVPGVKTEATEVKAEAPATDTGTAATEGSTATTETVSSDAPSTGTVSDDVTPAKPGLKELADSVKPTLKPGKPSGLFQDVAAALSGKASSDSTGSAASASDSSASASDKSDAPKGAPHKSVAKAKKSSE